MIEISLKHSQKIKKLCEPLFTHFGINYFWYSRTTANGDFISVGSNPKFHEFYFYQKLFKCSPFFRKFDFIDSGIYLYRSCGTDEFQNTIDIMAAEMGTEFTAGIVERRKNELIRFGYATIKNNRKFLQSNFINNIAIFKKFNEYFLHEAESILPKFEENYISLPQEVGKDFYSPPKGFYGNLSPIKKCKFLEDMSLLDVKLIETLTPRERDCLKLIKEGSTASLIGFELGLSKRTVESYLQSIKNKLLCDTKNDLFQISRLLDLASFFD